MSEQTTAYVVCAKNYEYNDENYYRIGGVAPCEIFATRESAEAEARRRERHAVHTGEEPFFALDEEYDERAYEELVSMPWFAWRDWLADRDVPLPECAVDGEPDLASLKRWWSPELWTQEQIAHAAEHLILDTYEVVEIPFHK